MSQPCVFCGAPIGEADRFCGHCGKPHQPPPPPPPPPPLPVTEISRESPLGPRVPPPPPPPMVQSAPVAAASGGAWSIVLREESGQASTHFVDRELRLGRAMDCEIRFDDTMASRIHAMLRPAPEGIWLTDNNSTNGTRVSGRRIRQPLLLCGGEVIEIGNTRFEVQSPGSGKFDATVVMMVGRGPVAGPTASSTQVQCARCQTTNSARNVVCQSCGQPL